MKKNFLLILVFISFIACTSQKEIMNSWLGATKQQLIMRWGPPTRTTSDGETGEILVYAKHVYVAPHTTTLYDNNAVAHTSTTQAVNYWSYRFFFIDSDGKIYHWLVQRQEVPPTEIDLNVYKKY